MLNSAAASPLASLQDAFAILDLGGELRVVRLEQVRALKAGKFSGDLSLYKRPDAATMFKRHLEQQPSPSKPNQVIEDFWSSPATVMYRATAFTPVPQPPDVLNFWVGSPLEARRGNWVILRDYLHDVICAKSASAFEYLIRYMAHMVQRPEEKPGVMVVLLGGQGTGKGVYFSLLRALWPCTTLLVSDVDQVLGRFNSCLERNFIVCMDEALFAGDRKSVDRLKSLVTESTIHIEQKYQPQRSIDSVHRWFAASNHEHFSHVERDDRRQVFLRVSADRQQDTAYFSKIAAAIADPGTVAALLYYLQRMNLHGFDVRRKPATNEGLDQKLQSLQGFDRFWYEVLMAGAFPPTDSFSSFAEEWDGPVFAATRTLLARFKRCDKNAERHGTVQSAAIVKAVHRLCPSAKSVRQVDRKAPPGTRTPQRGFDLPDLGTARRDFESVMGGVIDWD
jgi:hypothetical protein